MEYNGFVKGAQRGGWTVGVSWGLAPFIFGTTLQGADCDFHLTPVCFSIVWPFVKCKLQFCRQETTEIVCKFGQTMKK